MTSFTVSFRRWQQVPGIVAVCTVGVEEPCGAPEDLGPGGDWGQAGPGALPGKLGAASSDLHRPGFPSTCREFITGAFRAYGNLLMTTG